MITFSNVTKIYDNGTKALDNVSFHIPKGDFVFIIGHSGAGKSTITKLLTHEETPTSGNIRVNHFDVTRLKAKDIPYLRRGIGMVFQDFRLLPKKTVWENVSFAMEIIGASSREIRRQVPNLLSMVGLAQKARSYPNQLSGGEQQRVAMARALANNPPVLIADEPTGNLDPQNSEDIMQLLEEINRHGTTVVVVSHDRDMVNSMKKRVIVLDDGKLFSDEERGEYHEVPVL